MQKHDKHSHRPLRAEVVEHLFSQAFYLSLESSYLFTACKDYLHEHPVRRQPALESDSRQRTFKSRDKDETLEVPAHFERK